jgi:hypothetical protein
MMSSTGEVVADVAIIPQKSCVFPDGEAAKKDVFVHTAGERS